MACSNNSTFPAFYQFILTRGPEAAALFGAVIVASVETIGVSSFELCPMNSARVLVPYACGAITVGDIRVSGSGIAPFDSAQKAFVFEHDWSTPPNTQPHGQLITGGAHLIRETPSTSNVRMQIKRQGKPSNSRSGHVFPRGRFLDFLGVDNLTGLNVHIQETYRGSLDVERKRIGPDERPPVVIRYFYKNYTTVRAGVAIQVSAVEAKGAVMPSSHGWVHVVHLGHVSRRRTS